MCEQSESFVDFDHRLKLIDVAMALQRTAKITDVEYDRCLDIDDMQTLLGLDLFVTTIGSRVIDTCFKEYPRCNPTNYNAANGDGAMQAIAKTLTVALDQTPRDTSPSIPLLKQKRVTPNPNRHMHGYRQEAPARKITSRSEFSTRIKYSLGKLKRCMRDVTTHVDSHDMLTKADALQQLETVNHQILVVDEKIRLFLLLVAQDAHTNTN
jgi:hypothetical protein